MRTEHDGRKSAHLFSHNRDLGHETKRVHKTVKGVGFLEGISAGNFRPACALQVGNQLVAVGGTQDRDVPALRADSHWPTKQLRATVPPRKSTARPATGH